MKERWIMIELMPDCVLLRELHIKYGTTDENLRSMGIHEEIDGVMVIRKTVLQTRTGHDHKKVRNAAEKLLEAYGRCTNLKGMIRLRTLSKHGLISHMTFKKNREDFASQVVTIGRWQFVKPSKKLREVIQWAQEGMTLFRATKKDFKDCDQVMHFGKSIYIGAYS